MTARQFKIIEQQILQLLNNSGLPVAGAYYLIKSISLELELLYERALANEMTGNNQSTEEQELIINPDNIETDNGDIAPDKNS